MRLDTHFVSQIAREVGTTWVKFIRVNDNPVVGPHYNRHRDIASITQLPLLEEWVKSERFQGAHDHGHIHIENQRAIVYVYGESVSLSRFDSENHIISPPELPDIDTIPKNEYEHVNKKFLGELDIYEMRCKSARIETCRIVAPLFTAVINNLQIFWSLDMGMDGELPKDRKFTLFEAL